MDVQDNVISLDDEIKCFGRYFDSNSKCILSARFGEGKSFFLKEFIKAKSGEYDFITLYPTNYQTCDNKDIFEYIKRDILLALLALDESILNGLDKTYAEIIWESIIECKGDLISALPEISIGISGAAGVSISTSNILAVVQKVLGKCRKKWGNKGNVLKDYLDGFKSETGTLYEFNPISNLISDLIGRRKKTVAAGNARKVVLVIEDLDRIDPAHIFRILNVFSAHLDDSEESDYSKNKFGFDKVLLLCDYDNVKNIYYHLYGEKTDFNGYISKFSPKGVYTYSLRSKVKEYMVSLLPEDLRSTFPSIIELIANEIFDESGISRLTDDNLRAIKMKFLDFKKSIISEKIYFSAFEIGPFIKTENIELINLLALCKMFNVDLSALLKAKQDSLTNINVYHIIAVSFNNELYHLCWPYVIMKEGHIKFDQVNYHDESMKCLNGHREFIVEYKDSEILKINHGRGYIVFSKQNMEEIYQFIENYKKYVG